MNWLLSILIGVMTGVAGIACGLFLGSVNVRWYRISSFEGGSGYYVIAIGLAGGVLGLITGIVATRIAAAGGDVSFLKGLGIALGSMAGLTLVVMGLCWLGADIAPTIGGNRLDLEVEVRAPKRFTKNFPREQNYPPRAYLENSAGKTKSTDEISLNAARFEDGRWVVPVKLSLNTRSSEKRFRAYFNKEFDAMISMRLRGNPRKSDLEWSPWFESAWNASEARPTADQAFWVRYRVVIDEPKPRVVTEQEEAAKQAGQDLAELNAVRDSASLHELFPFTELNRPEELRRAAIGRIEQRSNFGDELAGYVNSIDLATASNALRVVGQLEVFPKDLHDSVALAGRHLVEWKAALAMGMIPPGCDSFDEYDYGAASRHWLTAVKQMRAKAGGDFTEEFAALIKDVDEQTAAAMREWGGFPAVASK